MVDDVNLTGAISPSEIIEDYFSDESAPRLKFVDDHYSKV